MNKTKESIVSKLKPIDNIKPIPISKKCQHCKENKLLSEFQFSIKLKTKDHRVRVCNNCIEKTEVEEQENCGCHSDDCITDKFLQVVETQLSTLLDLSENGVLIPDEILGLMAAIFEQDEQNLKDQED